MRVEVHVLGTLVVTINGISIVPAANKPSQVLALLAVNPGSTVSISVLAEELWGADLPPSAISTMRTYILQLRRRIRLALRGEDGAAQDVLRTSRSRYLLDIPPDDVDAVRYLRLSEAGRAMVNQGDDEKSSRLLGEALKLWRGPALADVSTGPVLAIEAKRMEEHRLGDLHLRIASDLRLGRHQQLLGELATLTAQHPLLENFCRQYMLALYRSGRPGQAFAAYQDLRSTMAGQLGVTPSNETRQLYNAMCRGAPSPDSVGAGPAP